MSAAGPLELVRGALAGERAWIVGGALRDALLGRTALAAALDLDLACDGDLAQAADRVRRAAGRGAAAFALSDAHGSWRIVGAGGAWHVDLAPLGAGGIEADLRARDLTLNALAEPLAGGALVDPTGGRADLQAGVLRMVSAEAFAADPLRVLRVARLAVELGLEPESQTLDAAARRASALESVSGERVFAELRRVIGSPAPVHGLALLDQLGATAVVLPELHALRGVEQTVYHHRDVHGHTLEVLEQVVALEDGGEATLGAPLAPRVRSLLREPLADDLTRGGALRWAALLHDIAKPLTRADLGDGRVGFPGHDREGARIARELLTRLRASERLRAHVAAITRHHLRLGFLVHQRPLSRRVVHRYLVACDPVAADVTLLGVADRLATRGRKADEAVAAHLEVAIPMLGDALDRHEQPRAAPLIRGDELARALELEPGPKLGELLAAIDEARFAGEVDTPAGAIEEARRVLEREGR